MGEWTDADLRTPILVLESGRIELSDCDIGADRYRARQFLGTRWVESN